MNIFTNTIRKAAILSAASLLSFTTAVCSTLPVLAQETELPAVTERVSESLNLNQVLGDSRYFGIVASSFTTYSHTQTNFAAKTVSGNSHVIEPDLIRNTGDIPFLIGDITTNVKFGHNTGSDGKISYDIFTGMSEDELKDKLVNQTFPNVNDADNARYSLDPFYYSEDQIDGCIDNMISSIRLQSELLADHDNLSAEEVRNMINMHGDLRMDLSGEEYGDTVYLHVDGTPNQYGHSFLSVLDQQKFRITKRENQKIVITTDPSVSSISIKNMFITVNGTEYRSESTQQANSFQNNSVENYFMDHLIWNLANVKNADLDSAETFLAPNADQVTYRNMAGRLITSGDVIGNSEWHFIHSGLDGYEVNAPEKPEDPVQPDEPEQPVNPIEPVEPNEPEVPELPEDPDTPEEPGESEKPIEPEEPDVPAVPEEPAKPLPPANTILPVKPGNPDDAETQEPSETPVNPDEPAKPVQPEEPKDPAETEEPTDPIKPEVPVTPEKPVQPDQPVEEEKPADPDQPANSEKPAEPEKPVLPSFPSESENPEPSDDEENSEESNTTDPADSTNNPSDSEKPADTGKDGAEIEPVRTTAAGYTNKSNANGITGRNSAHTSTNTGLLASLFVLGVSITGLTFSVKARRKNRR